MPSDLPIITLRLAHEDNAKIKYIANDNCRKINDELKMLVLKHIKEYEAIHGELIIEEDGTVHPKQTRTNDKRKLSTYKVG